MKIKIESPYLKAKINIQDGEYITFLNEGEYQPSSFDPKKKSLVCKVGLADGEEKIFTLSNKNQGKMLEAFGDDSKNWIGKKVQVEIVKKDIGGTTKTLIYLKPEGFAGKDEESEYSEEE